MFFGSSPYAFGLKAFHSSSSGKSIMICLPPFFQLLFACGNISQCMVGWLVIISDQSRNEVASSVSTRKLCSLPVTASVKVASELKLPSTCNLPDTPAHLQLYIGGFCRFNGEETQITEHTAIGHAATRYHEIISSIQFQQITEDLTP